MKNQKGITLIALVITIIVLLILAGITIAMLTGENGLLTKSKHSAAAAQVGAAKDEVSIAFQKQMADYLQDKYTADKTPTPPTAANVIAGVSNMHGCAVIADSEDTNGLTILVLYPASVDSTTNNTTAKKKAAADYYAVGTIDATTMTLSWTDNS